MMWLRDLTRRDPIFAAYWIGAIVGGAVVFGLMKL